MHTVSTYYNMKHFYIQKLIDVDHCRRMLAHESSAILHSGGRLYLTRKPLYDGDYRVDLPAR